MGKANARVLLLGLAGSLGLCACSHGAIAPATGTGADAGVTDGGDEASAAACIDATSAGDHEYTCSGIKYDVSIPPACATHGACGLIVDVHGFTMSGKMEDANTNMRALGAQYGYVVIQPNANPAPPGSSWNPRVDDDLVYPFVAAAVGSLGVDPKRVHMTGFSQGGMMTFRFLCKHADLFASVAPGAGEGCTFQQGNVPSREIPVLYMHGTMDGLVSFTGVAIPQRDQVVMGWNMGAGTVVAQGNGFVRTRYTSPSGNVFEFLQHDYVSKQSLLKGHCFPGSTDPGTQPGQLFPFGCVPPNAFDWGQEVMKFFMAHEG